ncbi:MAG TPA: biotin/lipoyl-containing protein, partial [Acidimicrobiia bacterium]|nr:biotin/lipoyl-containing protein [Acidimicrobiia bacterium]
MSTTVSMPQLGETVTEGTILRWAKQVGDQVSEDEVLVEISTDKVDTEVPSPASGTVLEILVPEGETVEVGTPLVVIGAEGEEAAEAAEPAAEGGEQVQETEPAPEQAPEADSGPEPETEPETEPEPAPVAAAETAPEPAEASSAGAADQPAESTTVSMPQLGETVTEGTILRWAKQVGDQVSEDEVLVEISTDKVDTEVPSPASGTV